MMLKMVGFQQTLAQNALKINNLIRLQLCQAADQRLLLQLLVAVGTCFSRFQ
ncbi:hypothetical protein H8B14_03850 [Hymenobacter sp. BT190]|nr:hypothetical protein [Hymenobacter sp. BT190]MBC6697235.1 hypothetical protein [Hymenobacter sp. BT190]